MNSHKKSAKRVRTAGTSLTIKKRISCRTDRNIYEHRYRLFSIRLRMGGGKCVCVRSSNRSSRTEDYLSCRNKDDLLLRALPSNCYFFVSRFFKQTKSPFMYSNALKGKLKRRRAAWGLQRGYFGDYHLRSRLRITRLLVLFLPGPN